MSDMEIEQGEETGKSNAPVEWGCAEFREVIGFMRERWPEIAQDAEHPILEALLAAKVAGDKRRQKQLRPMEWIVDFGEKFWAILDHSPLTLRQIVCIDLGYVVSCNLNRRCPNLSSTLIFLFASFHLIAALTCILVLIAFRLDRDGMPFAFMALVIVTGLLGFPIELKFAKRIRVETHGYLRRHMDRLGVWLSDEDDIGIEDNWKTYLGILIGASIIFLFAGGISVSLYNLIIVFVSFVVILIIGMSILLPLFAMIHSHHYVPIPHSDPAEFEAHFKEVMIDIQNHINRERLEQEFRKVKLPPASP